MVSVPQRFTTNVMLLCSPPVGHAALLGAFTDPPSQPLCFIRRQESGHLNIFNSIFSVYNIVLGSGLDQRVPWMVFQCYSTSK